jgi:hypothetical protein
MKDVYQLLILLFFPAILFFGACEPANNASKDAKNIDVADADADFHEAKKIFYNLPSPPEVSDMLFSESGPVFNEAFLNRVENVDLYESSVKQALNLGIYSTDFSFASIAGQDQIAINYFATSQKLATRLGLSNVLSQDTINWLARNFENKDSLMDIITVVYRRSEAYFNENGEPDLALLMAIGGWTEGMYLATKLAKDLKYNTKIMDQISEQRLSMEIIVQIIESNKNEPNIHKYHEKFTTLNGQYKTFSNLLKEDLKQNKPVSQSTLKEFLKLEELVAILRNDFIN